MGGMVALSISERHPNFSKYMINISGATCSLPYSIALRNIQKASIEQDPLWNNGFYDEDHYPYNGMMLARKIGLLSYRSKDEVNQRFSSNIYKNNNKQLASNVPESVDSYLEHNARRFVDFFDANSYLVLSNAINKYVFGGSRKSVKSALKELPTKRALIMGVNSDELFPIQQQEQLASGLKAGGCTTTFIEVDSNYGHDAFLVDINKFGSAIRDFLSTTTDSYKSKASPKYAMVG